MKKPTFEEPTCVILRKENNNIFREIANPFPKAEENTLPEAEYVPCPKSENRPPDIKSIHFPRAIFLRLKQLTGDRKKGIPGMLNISRSTLYNLIKKGIFPAPYKLSERCSGWYLDDVKEYLENLKK